MAGTSIDMSKVKQLLQLKQSGMSNRQIAKTLGISRDKANEFVKQAESDPLGVEGLLKLDDPVLDKRMHPGNPAYTDERMEEFLRLLPDFVEQLSRKHVTRQIVWEDYKRIHPDGYERSQFFYHLSQNLKAQKAPTSVLHHEPGLELYVDFAGDTLSYIDIETGEMIKVQTFVSTLACTDYAFVLCVPSQDSVEDRRTRSRLIRKFYFHWMARHEDRKVFNKTLNDYIHIKYISVNETAGHASLRYLSTLAVLQLDAILPNAVLKDSKPANTRTKNQKGFKRMLIMEYNCPAIGMVRLTVGQKASDDSKVQYCITAIDVHS